MKITRGEALMMLAGAVLLGLIGYFVFRSGLWITIGSVEGVLVGSIAYKHLALRRERSLEGKPQE